MEATPESENKITQQVAQENGNDEQANDKQRKRRYKPAADDKANPKTAQPKVQYRVKGAAADP